MQEQAQHQQATRQESKKKELVFATRAQEELYWAGKQLTKTLMILVVLAILLYLAHFFSMILAVVLFFIGLILMIATGTYTVGHFVRYLIFSSRKI
ncbi:MAG: hypothetical protein ACXVP5_11810 [Tumebacillaceae bacterium]